MAASPGSPNGRNVTENDTEAAPLLATRSHSSSRTLLADDNAQSSDRNYQTIPNDAPEDGDEHAKHSLWEIISILSVLLIGVFVSQADTTLLLAIIGNISGEFHDLENSGWLFSSYGLAMCVAQPLYGKLSDIYGRKNMLQVAYLIFAIGGAISGLGRSMGEIIAGRVVQGCGGAGMVSLVSILITDLVPLRDVAAYRSYVNIVQTVGRSAGGPIGGALAQAIGWRAAFVVQAPLTLLAMILVAFKLKTPPAKNDLTRSQELQSTKQKLGRIDFLGALFSSTTIFSAVLILDMGGTKVPWSSPIMPGLAAAFVVSATFFYLAEKKWAKEPIFPLVLLGNKHVVLTYVLLIVQVMSQIGLIFFIPLYFQVTKNASPAAAGAYMAITVVGNTVGGLLTGYYIQRTGRYKALMIISGLSAILCFTLLLLTWHGNTPAWQSSFVLFGGFATGIAQSALFVDLAATVDESDIAIASSGLYLCASLGGVSGVTAANTVFSTALKAGLKRVLVEWPNGHEIAQRAASDVKYVQGLHGAVHDLVLSAYISAFRHCYAFSLCCASCALLMSLIMREKKLR